MGKDDKHEDKQEDWLRAKLTTTRKREPRWLRNLLRVISTEEPHEFLVEPVRSNPEASVKLLVQLVEEIEKLQHQVVELGKWNETLIREQKNNHRRNSELEARQTKLSENYSRLLDENDRLARQARKSQEVSNQMSDLSAKLAGLGHENESLRKNRDDLDERVSTLMRELAGYRRSKTEMFVSDMPQVHLILQDFKYLKDQKLNAMSGRIYDAVSRQTPRRPNDRREEIARIKSVLSEAALVKESQFLSGKLAMASVMKFLVSVEELPVSAIMRGDLCDVVKAILSKEISFGESARTQNEADLFGQRMAFVLNALKLFDNEFQSDILDLFRVGRELVRRVFSTDPPGELWVENEGTTFDPSKHEIVVGSSEGSFIATTVVPGYRVNGRVLEKAIVLTNKT